MFFHFILFYFILFYFILFYFIYFILFFSFLVQHHILQNMALLEKLHLMKLFKYINKWCSVGVGGPWFISWSSFTNFLHPFPSSLFNKNLSLLFHPI